MPQTQTQPATPTTKKKKNSLPNQDKNKKSYDAKSLFFSFTLRKVKHCFIRSPHPLHQDSLQCSLQMNDLRLPRHVTKATNVRMTSFPYDFISTKSGNQTEPESLWESRKKS